MSIPLEILPEKISLSPGADLWVLPHKNQGTWVSKFNWHSNFQFLKNETSEACLILTEDHFPNQKTLILEEIHESNWSKELMKKWEKMGFPSLRVFLPRQMNPKDFQKEFSPTGAEKVQVIPHE